MLWAGIPAIADAGEHYALVVTGASGGPEYAAKYRGWRETFVRSLGEYEYASHRITVLGEEQAAGVRPATRENVRAALLDLRQRATAEDEIVILLMGHGVSGEDDEAKFNLVGPDLTASEWRELVQPIPARVVFINTASGSFPFLRALAGRGRIVVTANASSAQQYETVFPEFFVAAFAGLAADNDRSGKVSIWEAFVYATDRVRRWYEERGQLPTERAMLDDNGDGVGREATGEGPDGAVARTTFLQPQMAIAEPADTVLGVLLRRRAALETNLENLKARKASVSEAEYQEQLERLLLEIATLDRQIRAEPGR